MEPIEAVNLNMQKEKKEKKPRSEKQLEAFKRCAEKRRIKLLEKEQGILSEKKEKENQTNLIKSMMEQINQLKNQVQVQVQTQNQTQVQPQVQPQVQNQSQVQVESQVESQVQVQVKPQVKPHFQIQSHQYQHQHQHQPTHMDLGMGLGYSVSANSNLARNNNNKRDIRGMDPFADERQGMMERVYTRNVNLERQKEMDRVRQTRFADENSIQLLQPQPQYDQDNRMEIEDMNMTMNNRYNNDPRGRIESQAQNMSSVIRTGSLTNQARRAGAIAVNGLRVASRR